MNDSDIEMSEMQTAALEAERAEHFKKTMDWECLEINEHGLRNTDSFQGPKARRKRFNELHSLLALPYWTAAQNLRIGALRGCVKFDNHYAHKLAMAKRNGGKNEQL